MWAPVNLGKYQAVRPLGEGGICTVFLARDPERGRDVVVKVLRDEMRNHTKAREHFRREIHIMSRFKHPHAVAYLDAEPNANPSPRLVLEYLRGSDLADVVHPSRPFPPERAGRVLAQLCAVLGAAHEAGIVHRDVKPANIMLLRPGMPGEIVKLVDFGLAKMASMLYLDAEVISDWTHPEAGGTPEYLAPELILRGDIDARGDLYSLGVVLFEMLVGRRPFESATVEALLQDHSEKPPPTFAALQVRHPKSLAVEPVVRRCLAKVPDERFQTAEELIVAYEKALGVRLRPNDPLVSASPSPGPGSDVAPLLRASDRHAVRHTVQANIPESMVLLKIKGFIQDLGGEMVDSVPGLIRVRLGEKPPPARGFFGPKAAPPRTDTHIELHMERPDPDNPGHLSITLVMRSGSGLASSSWRDRCEKIGRDLKAYLVGW